MEKIFYVQKALLVNASSYFATALGDAFVEGKTHELTLPGCDLKTFEVFLYWLGHKHLPRTSGWRAIEEVCYDFQERLLQLWLFADRYMLLELREKAESQLSDELEEYCIHTHILGPIFQNCAVGSHLRDRAIEAATRDFEAHEFDIDELDDLNEIPGVLPAILAHLRATRDIKRRKDPK